MAGGGCGGSGDETVVVITAVEAVSPSWYCGLSTVLLTHAKTVLRYTPRLEVHEGAPSRAPDAVSEQVSESRKKS